RAHLLFGGGLNVRAGGTTRELYRPAFEVTVTAGQVPSRPRRMTKAAVMGDLVRLSVGLAEGTLPRLLSQGGGGTPQGQVVGEKVQTARLGQGPASPFGPAERPE